MNPAEVPDRLRLPLSVDARDLATEVAALPDEVWIAHFNQRIYHGDWSGVPLRAAAGREATLYSHPDASEFTATEISRRCPHLDLVVQGFRCPLTSVRLLALGPGAVIDEHRDFNLAYADGEVRLHLPIATDPAVEFYLDGRRVDMAEGECWYLNLNLPHRVANHSAKRRVHLVVDCVVNAWLEAQFQRGCDDRRRASPPGAYAETLLKTQRRRRDREGPDV